LPDNRWFSTRPRDTAGSRHSADADDIAAMEKMEEGRNHIVFLFTDCEELSAVHAGKEPTFAHSGAVMILMNEGSIRATRDMTRAGFIDEASQHLSTVDMASLRDELRQRTQQSGVGLDLGDMKMLGVLKKDELGIYLGFLIPARR
jgi:hypothetical protein